MTPQRWQMLAALILTVATVTFAAGAISERAQREGGEHREAVTGAGITSREADEGRSDSEGSLGIEAESPVLIGIAVSISLLLAGGAFFRPKRMLFFAIIVFALVFALLDVLEFTHQADESNTGLLLVAGSAAVLHIAAAGAAARVVTERR